MSEYGIKWNELRKLINTCLVDNLLTNDLKYYQYREALLDVLNLMKNLEEK